MRISDWSSDVCSSDLDLHLAPPNGAAAGALGAAAVLERDRPFLELAVTGIDRDDPIEHDRQLRALRRDLVGVPLSARLRPRIPHGDIDNGSGSVFRTSVERRVGKVCFFPCRSW